MPSVILALVVVIAFALYFLVWAGTNAQLQAVRSGQIPEPRGGTAQLEEALRMLGPDHVQEIGVGVVVGIGRVMLIVFAASHIGTEFGWGTLRTLLAHGAGRGTFLASKAASLGLFAAVLVAVGTLGAIGASYAVVGLGGGSSGAGVDLEAVASIAAKGIYTCLPYMALAVGIAVLARSAGAGIGAGLVVLFAEGIIADILVALNRDYAQIVNWGLARNVTALARATSNVESPSAGISLPDPAQAAITLGAYTAIFMAIAYWRLRTRDVTIG
jgi:ABC-type transport system involved in multi-copper enzyme maturation permease subunit